MDLRAIKESLLDDAARRFADAAGDGLRSLVLYGAAAHGDFYGGNSELHLLVVLRDLELATLRTIDAPMAWWLRKKQPMPRLFSAELLATAADVFPMELADLASHRVVLWGQDPLGDVVVVPRFLRLQCERELREKMMRLREGFMEARGKDRALARLMAESYSAFLLIFRGSLYLREGQAVPQHDSEVVDALADWAAIDAEPLHRVEDIKHGRGSGDAKLFGRYYNQLTRAVEFIDGFVHSSEESS